MAELIRWEIVELPALQATGKVLRHSMEATMAGDNPIPAFWDQCFGDGTFTTLEAQPDALWSPDYIGLMADWQSGDGKFTYLTGMLLAEGAAVPAGFETLKIPAGRAAVGYIRGRDTGDVCSVAHGLTEQALRAAGHSCDKMTWCMEYYNCPRFTTPDEEGRITLDYYIPLD